MKGSVRGNAGRGMRRGSAFALVLACVFITAGCCPAQPEVTATQTAHAERENTPKTEQTIPWVCYDCGCQRNTGDACAICGAEQDATVTADGVIEIAYPENPSTGFLWSCTVTPEDALEEAGGGFQSDLDSEEQNSSDPPTGVGGTRIYRFRPVKDGKVILCFTLARGPDEIDTEFIYTYTVQNGVPIRVAGARNTWACDCGNMHNRVEQVCHICERAMPGLEDSWFCSECWRCRTKDEASCPNCGEACSYENDWVCTCGYAVLDGHVKSCERCGTVPPPYAGGWVCAGCGALNQEGEPCADCGESDDYSSEVWVCACRHINNWSAPPKEWSDICAQCGKPRPVVGR